MGPPRNVTRMLVHGVRSPAMAPMPATVARVLDRGAGRRPRPRSARHPDRAASPTASSTGWPTGRRTPARPRRDDRATGWRRRCPNEADVVVAFHGAMRLGAVWVGINRALAAPEKRFLLEDCGRDGAALRRRRCRRPRRAGRRPGGRGGRRSTRPTADPIGVDVDPFAPAGIAYTSGTTGRPKGAVHSQHNLLVPGAVLGETRGYGPDLRKGDCFPFTILNLAVLTTLLVSQAGGTSILMDRIDAEGVAEWIRDERRDRLERSAAAALQPGDDGLDRARRPGDARRGVDRRRRLPRVHPLGVRRQVRPAGALLLRADRGADRRVDRPARRAPRRERVGPARCPTSPCASPTGTAPRCRRARPARSAWRPPTTGTG